MDQYKPDVGFSNGSGQDSFVADEVISQQLCTDSVLQLCGVNSPILNISVTLLVNKE